MTVFSAVAFLSTRLSLLVLLVLSAICCLRFVQCRSIPLELYPGVDSSYWHHDTGADLASNRIAVQEAVNRVMEYLLMRTNSVERAPGVKLRLRRQEGIADAASDDNFDSDLGSELSTDDAASDLDLDQGGLSAAALGQSGQVVVRGQVVTISNTAAGVVTEVFTPTAGTPGQRVDSTEASSALPSSALPSSQTQTTRVSMPEPGTTWSPLGEDKDMPEDKATTVPPSPEDKDMPEDKATT
eukprot:scpid95976/ scgid32975/ 